MQNEEFVTGTVQISLFGEPVEMEMSVPAQAVKPTRMLPVLQAMTNSFVEIGVSAAENEGKNVSCKKGCGACCSQAVPLTPMETFYLRDLIEDLPEPRRSEIKRKFAEGYRHFAARGWFDRMRGYVQLTPDERVAAVLEYFYENISCPFLEDGACSIHPSRPLACREYLVTSPAENCSQPSARTINMIKLPVKVSEAARNLTRQPNGVPNFVPMMEALVWAEENAGAMQEKSGVEWLREFFQNLTGQEIEN